MMTFIIFGLSHCEVKMQHANAQLEPLVKSASGQPEIYISRKVIDSMEYIIFKTPSLKGGIEIVNITKDKLVVEKLKLEIQNLKK